MNAAKQVIIFCILFTGGEYLGGMYCIFHETLSQLFCKFSLNSVRARRIIYIDFFIIDTDKLYDLTILCEKKMLLQKVSTTAQADMGQKVLRL